MKTHAPYLFLPKTRIMARTVIWRRFDGHGAAPLGPLTVPVQVMHDMGNCANAQIPTAWDIDSGTGYQAQFNFEY